MDNFDNNSQNEGNSSFDFEKYKVKNENLVAETSSLPVVSPKKKPYLLIIVSISILIILGLLTWKFAPTLISKFETTAPDESKNLPISETPITQTSTPQGGLLSSKDVATKVKPSVVGISIYGQLSEIGRASCRERVLRLV